MRSLALVTLASLAATSLASAQDMLGLSWSGEAYGIDSASGDAVLAGWSGLWEGHRPQGLAVTPAGTVYAIRSVDQLCELDPVSGAATVLGSVGVIDARALTWDPSGQQLLAARPTAGSGSLSELWSIDPVTLQSEKVGTTNHINIQALGTAPDGTIYAYAPLASGAGLLTIDPATARSTDLFPAVPGQGGHQWLAVAASGEVLVGGDEIFRVDLATGEETLVGHIPSVDLRGVDFLPAPPSPWPVVANCFSYGAACPCGNESNVLEGCRNSYGWGARLLTRGSSSLAAGDLQLVTRGVIEQVPGVFFQGDQLLAGGSGVAFGDGLRCVGTSVVRLEVWPLGGQGGVVESTVDIGAVGGAQPGDSLHYQAWYRDPSGTPCGSGFNLTNALRVDWMP